MTILAVIDTSALFGSRHRIDLQSLAQAGLFIAVWSPWIIGELNRVLTWQWVSAIRVRNISDESREACGQAARTMMALLTPVFETVDPKPPYPQPWRELTDQWDVPIWAAAKASGAQYVVSENTRDFPPAQADGRHVFDGIEYVTVDAFVDMFIDEVDEATDEESPSWLPFVYGNGTLPDLLADDTSEE